MDEKEMWGWGYLCIVCMPCLAWILPSLRLVSVVFGTAIPTSLYIIGEIFTYTCTQYYIATFVIHSLTSGFECAMLQGCRLWLCRYKIKFSLHDSRSTIMA